MTDRGHMRVRQLINADRLPQSIAFHLSTVLDFAARDLSSNVAVFLDVDGTVQPPCGELEDPYGLTRSDLTQEPWSHAWDEAVMQLVSRYGPFPVLIWISQRVLTGELPSVFQTAALAHEVGHGRQLEQVPEISDAWTVYSDFLGERNHREIPRWYAPLEIDAELFGRKITRHFHADEELLRFQERYQDYDRVLRFESSGEFNLEDYFHEFVRKDGPSGFDRWLHGFLQGPEGRPHRGNILLGRLAGV
jgi:hypothetical protein